MSGDNKPICSSCDESNLPLHFEFNICSNCLFNRAHNETKNDNFLEAIELHEKGVEFDLSINDSQGAEHNLFGIALARERLRDYEIAEELFRTCLGECRKRGYDPESEHHYLGILVSYSIEKRDYEGTEQICNQLLPIQSELGKRHEEAMTTELLAWCALNRETYYQVRLFQVYIHA